MRVVFCTGVMSESKYDELPKEGGIPYLSGLVFQSILNLAGMVVKGCPDMFGYLQIDVRTRNSDLWGKYRIAEITDRDRCVFLFTFVPEIPTLHNSMRGLQISPALVNLISQDTGSIPIEGIVRSDLSTALSLKNMVGVNQFNMPMIVRAESGVNSDGSDGDDSKGQDACEGRILSCIVRTLVPSSAVLAEWQKPPYMKFASKYLTALGLKKLDERLRVLRSPVDVKYLETIALPHEGKKRVVCHSGTNWVDNVPMYNIINKLYALKKIDGFVATFNYKNEVPVPTFTEVHYGLGPREYVKKVTHARVYVNPSTDHGLSLVAVEMMALGVVPVFAKCQWVLALVPEDYPFLFTNEKEMFAMIDYLMTHSGEYSKYVMELAKKFDHEDVAKAYKDLIRENLEETSKVYNRSLDQIKEHFKLFDKFEALANKMTVGGRLDFASFVIAVDKFCRSGFGPIFARSEYLEILRKMGYKDSFESTLTMVKI